MRRLHGGGRAGSTPPAPAPGVPAGARPGPSPRAAARGVERRPPERPEAPPARSWPSATLRRPPARRAPGPAPAAPGRPHSRVTAGDSPAGPGPAAAAAARLSRGLAPEAVRLIRRRHPEQPQRTRPRRPLPAPSASRAPGRPQAPDPGLRRLLRVSLLNDRHQYDDEEYEEGAAAPDERLVRKCTEWLRGVESAARDRAGLLDTLPHLSAP